jgi:hypothetical protein
VPDSTEAIHAEYFMLQGWGPARCIQAHEISSMIERVIERLSHANHWLFQFEFTIGVGRLGCYARRRFTIAVVRRGGRDDDEHAVCILHTPPRDLAARSREVCVASAWLSKT